MTAAYVGSATNTGTTPVTVTYTGQAGNLLVAVLRSNDGLHGGHTAPAGWTKIIGSAGSATTAGTSIWWKQAVGDTSHTFSTTNTATTMYAHVVEFSGDFNWAALVAETATAVDPGSTVATLGVSGLTLANSGLVVACIGSNGSSTFSWSNGAKAGSDTVRSSVAYQVAAAAGDYGNTCTLGTANRCTVIGVAFAETAPVASQILSPATDINVGSWTRNPTGGTLASALAEKTETAVIELQSSSFPSTARFKLSTGQTPQAGDRSFRVRMNKVGTANVAFTVQLFEGGGTTVGGGTLKATVATTRTVEGWFTMTATLNQAITNYGDLYVEINAAAG